MLFFCKLTSNFIKSSNLLNPSNISKSQSLFISNSRSKLICDSAFSSINASLLSDTNVVLYAPDFLINAGGLINVYSELKGFSESQVKEKTEKIFDTTIAILKKSEKDNISSQKAALQIAKERVFKTQSA